MTETLISADEFAARFGWKRRTALENARKHGWPVIRVGRRVWFTETLYERILAQHTVAASAPAADNGLTSASKARAS